MNRENNEIKLIKALKIGDAKAFDKLFFLYGNRLYHFTYGYLKSKESAEEVVQEVFLRIWRNRNKLKPELSFKAYLFKIAYHFILEYFEHFYRHQVYKDKITGQEEVSVMLRILHLIYTLLFSMKICVYETSIPIKIGTKKYD